MGEGKTLSAAAGQTIARLCSLRELRREESPNSAGQCAG